MTVLSMAILDDVLEISRAKHLRLLQIINQDFGIDASGLYPNFED
jgi:hypothetical protein